MTLKPSLGNGIHKLGIIVPYRNRKYHLAAFIPHIHHFLSQVPHELLIIEQTIDGKPFNRGKLLNIGYTLAKNSCTYLCFHDIDMLPVQADYSYAISPTHLATSVEQFGYEMPYPEYFGGVTLMNIFDFELVNGYSNSYWGWGSEDDDLRFRCLENGLKIESRLGVFLSLKHSKAEESDPFIQANRERYEEFFFGNHALGEDGLKNLKFKLLKEERNENTFHCLVGI